MTVKPTDDLARRYEAIHLAIKAGVSGRDLAEVSRQIYDFLWPVTVVINTMPPAPVNMYVPSPKSQMAARRGRR